MEALQKENISLLKKIETMAEARNKEILDLQFAFAERIRELEKLKGCDSSEKIAELTSKIVSLQENLRMKEKECVKYQNQILDQDKQIEAGKRREKMMRDEIEQLKIAAMKAQEPKEPEIDIGELIAPLETELHRLSDLVAEKQTEIDRLQNLVQEECDERNKLLAILKSHQIPVK